MGTPAQEFHQMFEEEQEPRQPAKENTMNRIANTLILTTGIALIVGLFIVNPLNTLMLIGGLVALSATLTLIQQHGNSQQ